MPRPYQTLQGNASATEGAQRRGALIVRASIVGVIGNMLLSAVKAVVGTVTGSIAIVLDAVNNLSDALSSIITIVGTRLSEKEPDRAHPFGHGRIEYLTTIIIAAIVLWAGVTSLSESVSRIIDPSPASYGKTALVIVALGVVAKIALGRYATARGRALESNSLKASGTDATMDAAISATTLVAAGVNLAFGIAVEAYLGVVISLVIVKAGIDILREALDKILGERMDSDLADLVRKTVEGVEGVRGAYDLTLNDYGPNRQMGSVHIEVDETMTARRIDALTREITTTVYRTCNVVIDAVGIYSTNVDDTSRVSSIRSHVNEIVWKHEHILEVHGFYLDDDARTISLDVVISFDEPHRASAAEAIREEIQAAFPEYVIKLTLDTDYSS